MKGTFFSQPLEYNLTIKGESWTQGSNIKGSLKLTIHSSEKIDLNNLGCHVCYCASKKFKAKDPKSIKVIESINFKENSTELKEKQPPQITFTSNIIVSTDTEKTPPVLTQDQCKFFFILS